MQFLYERPLLSRGSCFLWFRQNFFQNISFQVIYYCKIKVSIYIHNFLNLLSFVYVKKNGVSP